MKTENTNPEIFVAVYDELRDQLISIGTTRADALKTMRKQYDRLRTLANKWGERILPWNEIEDDVCVIAMRPGDCAVNDLVVTR